MVENPVATVRAVKNGAVIVEVADASACSRCAEGKGCGAALFSSQGEPISLTVELSGERHFAVGDKVRLSLEPRDLVRASLFVYGAPLAGLVIGAGVAYLFADPPTDGLTLAVSALGLIAGGVLGRHLAGRDHCIAEFSPSIIGPAGSG